MALEQKLPRGVWINKRAKMKPYCASIMLAGERVFLGKFDTAEEASKAYEIQRKQIPVERKVRTRAMDAYGMTINDRYQEFLKECERDEKGYVAVGAHFIVTDGLDWLLGADRNNKGEGYQGYTLVETQFRRTKGPRGGHGRLILHVWESECLCCGQPFEFKTHAAAKRQDNVLRTCPAHRGMVPKAPSQHALKQAAKAAKDEDLDSLV